MFEFKQISSFPAYIVNSMNAQHQPAVEKSEKQMKLYENMGGRNNDPGE